MTIWQTDLIASKKVKHGLQISAVLLLLLLPFVNVVSQIAFCCMLIFVIYKLYFSPQQTSTLVIRSHDFIYQNAAYRAIKKPLIFQFVVILNVFCEKTQKKTCLCLFMDSFPEQKWREFHYILYNQKDPFL